MQPNVRKPWWLRARDAITGRFMRLVDAMRRKPTSVVEKVKRKK